MAATARPLDEMIRSPRDPRAVGAVLGFCSSHAPQIFLRPPEEDPAEIERVHDGYRHIAQRITESGIDAVCVVALDHLHSHFLDLVPQFTILVADSAHAEFNGKHLSIPAAATVASDLLTTLIAQDFDIAFSYKETLDHSFYIPLHFALAAGLQCPVIPLVVNAYVPPQPSAQRCASLGAALSSWASMRGVRLAVWATGGMSHFPGTDRFRSPDLEADQEIIDWIRSGDWRKVANLDAVELDRRGMVEMRTWSVSLGARGDDQSVTYCTYWDSGHCGYAVLEF